MNNMKALGSGLAAATLLAGLAALGESEAPRVVTTIDAPGASGTFALDINSSGEVVGRYMSAGRTHGFLRATSGEITTIDFPGAVFTVAAAINDEGDIVGMYRMPAEPASVRHGYLRRNGDFTTIDPPGSVFTNALGINERGDVVGRFCVRAPCALASGSFRGFLWTKGEFAAIDFPGALETDLFKITADGRALGGYVDAGGWSHLFLMSRDDVQAVDLPGSPSIALDNAGLNARGDIVGTACDFSPCVIAAAGTYGFFLTKAGDFATIGIPGATATAASGINARGDVVGLYFDAAGTNHGFLLSAPRRDVP
jgi:uncharacterized membrane protein